MNDKNFVRLSGTCIRASAHKTLESGARVKNFTLAIGSEGRKRDGQAYERTDYASIVLWDELADRFESEFKLQDRIEIRARVQSRKFLDAEQVERYVTEFVALEILPLQRAEDSPS